MLIHHYYVWDEAILPEDERLCANIRLRRLTIDILLPGPTTLEQIRAIISTDGKVVNLTYRPPRTYLSPERTTVRLADGALGATAAGTAQVRQTMAAASRVQAHRNTLEGLRVATATKVVSIDLPFECDRHFCRRDDWGRDNMNDGIEIGLYQHEEPSFRTHMQHVWILHLELSARERPNVEPLQPGRFRVFQA